jgi:hypothetical protein
MTASFPGQEVACRACGRTYTCTPEDDYYDADTPVSGVCLSCLLTEGGLDPDTTPVKVIDLTGKSTDPRDLSRNPAGGAR